MAKAKPRKLKVFQAQLGFYDTVVAAASKAAALRAWGTRQDLFGDGLAREATERRDIDAALAHPDTPLRRAIGTKDPFGLNPGLPRLPDLPASPRKGPAKPKVAARRSPPPDRRALSAAEADRQALDQQRRREEDEFRQRRTALEAEEQAAGRRYDAERSKADSAVERERRHYVEAGGMLGPAD